MHVPPQPPQFPPPGERPSRRYRLTLLDRLGPDGGLLLRCASYGVYVFGVTLFAAMLAGGARAALLFGLGGAIAGFAVSWVAWKISGAAGAGFRAFIQPSGASTPYRAQYSYEESLAARGNVAGAIEAYERRLLELPHDADLLRRAAELCAGDGNDPARAAAIFRALRDIPAVAPGHALYASQRLIDLYRGPLNDDGRALVELRRLVETHPGTPAAAHAREAIRRIKGAGSGEQGAGGA